MRCGRWRRPSNTSNAASDALESQASIETIDRHQTLAEQAQQRARRKLEQVQYEITEVLEDHAIAEKTHEQAKNAHDTEMAKRRTLKVRETASANLKDELAQAEADLQKKRETKQPEREIQRAATQVANRREQSARHERGRLTTNRDLETHAGRGCVTAREPAGTAKALEALKQAASAQREAVAAAPVPQPRERRGEPSAEATAAADVPELYDSARKAEDEIAEAFKEIRAMDLAMVRDMPVKDARQDIDIVRPVRPELDAEALREDVRTERHFEVHKQELQKALRETSSMVNLAHRMLEMASQSVEGMKFGTDVAFAPEEAEGEQAFELHIQELAMEDVSGRFSDMSAVMVQAAAQQESGEEGEEEAAAAAAARASVDFEDLTEQVAEGQAPLSLGGDEEGEGLIPHLDRSVPAVGARRIGAAGQPAKWWYVDGWYTLGPFANPNRSNIDREFPPDSLVDLDASYVGKGDRTVRWQHVQSNEPELVPANAEEYGIWYAYTELHFDEARDMLIALGSDDRGVLKINGVTVWISSRRLKGWDIDEVWRRVHFRKGINRILYRVENGWLHVGFSMTLRVRSRRRRRESRARRFTASGCCCGSPLGAGCSPITEGQEAEEPQRAGARPPWPGGSTRGAPNA